MKPPELGHWRALSLVCGALAVGALVLSSTSQVVRQMAEPQGGDQRDLSSHRPADSHRISNADPTRGLPSSGRIGGYAERASDYRLDAPRKRNELGQPLPFRERSLDEQQIKVLEGATEGAPVSLTLFNDVAFTGRIAGRWLDKDGLRVAAVLEGRGPRDQFFMSWNGRGEARGLVELPSLNRAYEIVRNPDGTYSVNEWLYTDVVCATPLPDGASASSGIPRPDAENPSSARSARIQAAQVPLLQSRPGADAVIYIDFDGETVSGTAWSNGGTIIAPAARLTSAQITEVWQRVSRDFAPFVVNVTTDRSVYQSAPANRRTHCVVTENDAAAPGAGGVAYLDSFASSDASRKICWSFIDNDARDCAVVISHEVGHTLDLSHDGRLAAGSSPREEYYRGHGSGATGWAPVMGVGYYQSLVQWSKGEYARANNPENDLAIITSSQRTPYSADDHGGAAETATPIVKGIESSGIVERTGDQDWHSVVVGAGPQPVTLTVPVGTMLDAEVKIYSEEGTLLQTVNPANQLAASASLNFPSARRIFVSVTGTGKPEVSGTGYSAYSSLGSYTLLAGTPDPVNPPPLVRISEPVDGRRHPPGEPLNVRITVTDNDIAGNPGTIGLVELMTNGVKVADIPGPPYIYTLTPTNIGPLVLTARATDIDPDPKTGSSLPVTVDVNVPPAGSVRESFVPPVLNDFVQAVASDASNRIYIGGLFTTLDVTNAAPRIARLLPSGAMDPSFVPGVGPNAQVSTLAYSSAQQGLYIGGGFSQVNAVSRPALARLAVGQSGKTDGSLDQTFNAAIEGMGAAPALVRAINIQDDGKILVGGSFSSVRTETRQNLARLLPDGSPDPVFAPSFGGAVNCVALQPDGKILVGGAFTTVNGLDRKRLVRLDRDGSVDQSFIIGSGFDGPVNAVVVTLAGDVIVGGQFTSFNGRPFYNNMVKLSAAGTLSGTFNFTAGLNGVVNDLQLRPSGQILVSGLFTSLANSALGIPSTAAGRIFQINPDGTLDTTFNTGGVGANGAILDAISMGTGDLLLAGSFTTFNQIARPRLVVISGSEGNAPVITSPLFYNVNAGADLDFTFTASGVGPISFALTGTLPRGVSFDSATGVLTGTPLDAGQFDLSVVAVSSVSGSSPPTAFVLYVNSNPVPYDTWRNVWFSPADQTNAAVSGMLAVRNPDGLSNLLVYALGGGDPAITPPDLRPLVRLEPDGGTNYLTLTASKYPGAAVDYRVEYSSALTSWASGTNSVTILTNTPTQIKARAAVPWTSENPQFLRLKVIAP